MISFIVSVYDRPWNLRTILPMLKLGQSDECEIIVANNDPRNDGKPVPDAPPHIWLPTGAMGAFDSYGSANMAVSFATGDWLCFPSDDSLYVEDFSKIMLAAAARTGSGLVYCDCVYKQGSVNGNWPAYSVLEVSARMGRIDKTCFIVKRELFKGFPPHPQNYRDGALIEELVRSGVKHAKAPGVLVVHQ